MQIILREPVQNLGNIGDLINVKAGYARNFLLPYNKAMLATPDNVKEMEARKAEFEKEAAAKKATAEKLKAQLTSKVIVITANVGEEGKLYGSVGSIEIVEALAAEGIEIEKGAVRLADGPFHNAGEHEFGVHLHPDVEDASLKLDIQAQAAE